MGRVQSVSCSLTSQPWDSLGGGNGRKVLGFTCHNEKALPLERGPLVVHITGNACDIFNPSTKLFQGRGLSPKMGHYICIKPMAEWKGGHNEG